MHCLTVSLILLSVISLSLRSHAAEADEAMKPVAGHSMTEADFRRRDRPGEGAVHDESQVLIPSLRGCIVVRETARGLSLQSRSTGGVEADGFSPAESGALKVAATPFLGRPVSLDSLDDLSAKLEKALMRNGARMVRASFPDQEITGGVVVITLVPAVAGEVKVHGSPAFGQDFIRESFRARKGDPVSRDQVMEDLDWLNENPLRRVRATFGNGAGEADIDLALHVDADKPWRVYGGVDNTLSDRLGDERWFLGFQHGDLFHLDHRITAQLTAGLDYDALHGASVSYEMPLPWRHLLELSASVSESNSELSGATGLIDQNGTFQRYAAKYRIPLSAWNGWRQEWYAGASLRLHAYDFGTSSRDIQFFQIESGWQAQKQDARGATLLNAKLRWNPGWLSSGDADFTALGADGADSLIALLDVERSLLLGKSGSLTARLDAQWSSNAVLSADQFASAINGRVRGFDEIEGYGDSGASLTLEYQSPVLRLPSAGGLRGVVFVDSAVAKEQESGDKTELHSAGIGFRWQWRDLTAVCDLGFPLHAPDGVEEDPRLRFSIVARW